MQYVSFKSFDASEFKPKSIISVCCWLFNMMTDANTVTGYNYIID